MQAIKLGQLELLMFLFVGLTLLVLLGLVVYITAAQRRKRQSALRPKFQPAKKAPPSEIDPYPSFTTTKPALRLFRDPEGGSIRVEIDGGVYSTMADVADPDLKRTIIGLAMELIQFVGVLKAQPPSLAPMDKTATWREDLRAGSQAAKAQAQSTLAADSRPTVAPGAASELEERFLAYLAEMGQSSQSMQKPSMIRSIQQSLQPKPNLSEGDRGFVQDIEEIIQGQLRANPTLLPGGLHVQTGLDKRVAFVFEGQEYASVDEIPNRTAQEVIRNAIREWEARA